MGSTESVPTEDPAVVERRNRNIKRMDSSVRKKLRGGVQFNMKVLIRGSPGTGKTSLWRRLQGQTLPRDYASTQEIQTANINWAFKNVEEAVKVEVWDCVDRSTHSSDPGAPVTPRLDTSTVNVHQNAQAVMFMVNPFDHASLDYVAQQLGNCPKNLAVLVLLNFKDLPTPHQPLGGCDDASTQETPVGAADEDVAVAAEDAAATAALEKSANSEESEGDEISKKAPPGNTERLDIAAVRARLEPLSEGKLHCFECSMENCFGLKLLYSYLNIPFIALKKSNLEQALKVLEREATAAETDVAGLVAANAYDAYLEHLKKSGSNPNRKVEKQQQQQHQSPTSPPPEAAAVSDKVSDKAESARAASAAEHESTEAQPEETTEESKVPNDVDESLPLNSERGPSKNAACDAADPPPAVVKSPIPVGSVDDEIGKLNEGAEKGNLQDFFDGSDDDEDNEVGDAEEEEPAAAMMHQHPSFEDDSDSEDDAFYSAPKFGLTATTPKPVLPVPSPQPFAAPDDDQATETIILTAITPATEPIASSGSEQATDTATPTAITPATEFIAAPNDEQATDTATSTAITPATESIAAPDNEQATSAAAGEGSEDELAGNYSPATASKITADHSRDDEEAISKDVARIDEVTTSDELSKFSSTATGEQTKSEVDHEVAGTFVEGGDVSTFSPSDASPSSDDAWLDSQEDDPEETELTQPKTENVVVVKKSAEVETPQESEASLPEPPSVNTSGHIDGVHGEKPPELPADSNPPHVDTPPTFDSSRLHNRDDPLPAPSPYSSGDDNAAGVSSAAKAAILAAMEAAEQWEAEPPPGDEKKEKKRKEKKEKKEKKAKKEKKEKKSKKKKEESFYSDSD